MNKAELIKWLAAEDFSPIYQEADRIRKEKKGNAVYIRAILEFSNHCRRWCAYCGLNCGNSHVCRYRMRREEIVESAQAAIDAGYRTIVLQSGEDEYYTGNGGKRLGEIVKDIKQMGVAVTVSCGELDRETLKYIKKCGADRYLLKHETADNELYSKLHPCGTLAERIKCLQDIKELGYVTGSGFMTGLPGQTEEIIAEDLLLLKRLGCDMAGIGPFIPHPHTPLAEAQRGEPGIAERAVALARIIMPNANLPVTTSLGLSGKNKIRETFSRGANVIMKKITPDKYKKDYQIYPMKIDHTDIQADRNRLEQDIVASGREPI